MLNQAEIECRRQWPDCCTQPPSFPAAGDGLSYHLSRRAASRGPLSELYDLWILNGTHIQIENMRHKATIVEAVIAVLWLKAHSTREAATVRNRCASTLCIMMHVLLWWRVENECSHPAHLNAGLGGY